MCAGLADAAAERAQKAKLVELVRAADNETGPNFADAMQTPARYGYESSPGGINARNVHRATRHSLPADQDPHHTNNRLHMRWLMVSIASTAQSIPRMTLATVET